VEVVGRLGEGLDHGVDAELVEGAGVAGVAAVPGVPGEPGDRVFRGHRLVGRQVSGEAGHAVGVRQVGEVAAGSFDPVAVLGGFRVGADLGFLTGAFQCRLRLPAGSAQEFGLEVFAELVGVGALIGVEVGVGVLLSGDQRLGQPHNGLGLTQVDIRAQQRIEGVDRLGAQAERGIGKSPGLMPAQA
jgi:hypothetical protein